MRQYILERRDNAVETHTTNSYFDALKVNFAIYELILAPYVIINISPLHFKRLLCRLWDLFAKIR